MTKYYSASTNGFYSADVHGEDIPEDVVEISNEKWVSLLEGQADGKMISADKNNKPVLIDFPEPTAEEWLSINKSKKEKLMTECTQLISIFQDAVDLDMANEEDKRLLPLWKKYRVLLSRVNIEDRNKVAWPEQPK